MSSPDPAFDQAMFEIYRRAKDEANYTATIFLQMLTGTDGLTTAKTLINAQKESDGYTALYMKGRLDLTVESVVVENASGAGSSRKTRFKSNKAADQVWLHAENLKDRVKRKVLAFTFAFIHRHHLMAGEPIGGVQERLRAVVLHQHP